MVLGEGGITLCVASAENIYVRVGPDSVFGAGYRIFFSVQTYIFQRIVKITERKPTIN